MSDNVVDLPHLCTAYIRLRTHMYPRMGTSYNLQLYNDELENLFMLLIHKKTAGFSVCMQNLKA